MNFYPALSFSEEDKIRTTQPYDDALLITLRIGDYDVKRVMVDGGWWQCCGDYVPRPLQGVEVKTGIFDALQLSFDELRREACYSKGHG